MPYNLPSFTKSLTFQVVSESNTITYQTLMISQKVERGERQTDRLQEVWIVWSTIDATHHNLLSFKSCKKWVYMGARSNDQTTTVGTRFWQIEWVDRNDHPGWEEWLCKNGPQDPLPLVKAEEIEEIPAIIENMLMRSIDIAMMKREAQQNACSSWKHPWQIYQLSQSDQSYYLAKLHWPALIATKCDETPLITQNCCFVHQSMAPTPLHLISRTQEAKDGGEGKQKPDASIFTYLQL